MKLDTGQPAPLRFLQDHVSGFVHKNPDDGRPAVHRRGNFFGLGIRDVARTFGVENQADGLDLQRRARRRHFCFG